MNGAWTKMYTYIIDIIYIINISSKFLMLFSRILHSSLFV